MLALYLSDNRKLRTMDHNGNYQQPKRNEDEAVIDSQIELFSYFLQKSQKAKKKQQKKEDARKKADQQKKNKSKSKNKNKEKTKQKKKEAHMKKQYGFIKKKDSKNKKS